MDGRNNVYGAASNSNVINNFGQLNDLLSGTWIDPVAVKGD